VLCTIWRGCRGIAYETPISQGKFLLASETRGNHELLGSTATAAFALQPHARDRESASNESIAGVANIWP